MDHEPMLVECQDHGDLHCYVQTDGSHIPSTACVCRTTNARGSMYSLQCPIDLHRLAGDLTARIQKRLADSARLCEQATKVLAIAHAMTAESP